MLTSLKNPKVAAADRLKKGAARERDRSFLVEGAQGISEALDRQPPAIVALLSTVEEAPGEKIEAAILGNMDNLRAISDAGEESSAG